MAKYSGKDSDYLINQKYSMHFINHSKGKQILVYSGLFKDSKKEIKKW